MSDGTNEPRIDATLKNLPEEAQEELYLTHRPEDGESDPVPATAMLAEVPLRHGFTVSKSTFYEWRSWYALRRRLRRARERARQAELEAAADGTLDPEAIARVGQAAFTSEAVSGENIKSFIALERLRLQQKQLELDKAKLDLLQRKAEFADQVKAAAENRDGGVTAEEMAEIERKLKLL